MPINLTPISVRPADPWPGFAPISPRLSAALDAARWIAAGAVVANHLRSLMFADFPVGSDPGLIQKAFFFATGFGKQAVAIFFVLSGFLVGGEVVRTLLNGTFGWREYLIRRAARLYAVYLVALVTGGIFDSIGAHTANVRGLYSGGLPIPVISYAADTRLGAGTFFGNVLFGQGLWVPTFGSNDPLWSLACEAWYYVLLPLLLWPLLARSHPLWKRALVAVVAAFILLSLHGDILRYAPLWLLGLLPYFWPRTWRLPIVIAATGFTIALVASRTSLGQGELYLPLMFGIALSFALGLHSLSTLAGPAPAASGWHARLAGFSYSLYLTHWPFSLLLVALLAQVSGLGLRQEFSVRALALFTAVGVAAYAWALLVAHCTERHTPALRAWLRRQLPA